MEVYKNNIKWKLPLINLNQRFITCGIFQYTNLLAEWLACFQWFITAVGGVRREDPINISRIHVIGIFFILLLDDNINTYQDYYTLFVVLFLLHIIITFLPRIILTSRTVNQIHNKKIGFKTIIIGNSEKAKDTYLEICNLKKSSGHFILGYVYTNGGKDVIKTERVWSKLVGRIEITLSRGEEVILMGDLNRPLQTPNPSLESLTPKDSLIIWESNFQ